MSSCDRTAPTTWDSGYELDISWADDGIHGHLHFPVKPQVSPARDLTFVVGEWHTVRVEARGSVIAVTLDDKVPLPELITVIWQGRERFHFLNAIPIQEMADRWIHKFQRVHIMSIAALKRSLEQGDESDGTDKSQ